MNDYFSGKEAMRALFIIMLTLALVSGIVVLGLTLAH